MDQEVCRNSAQHNTLMFTKTFNVGTAAVTGKSELDFVVFPVADATDVVTTARLAENEEAAGWTRELRNRVLRVGSYPRFVRSFVFELGLFFCVFKGRMERIGDHCPFCVASEEGIRVVAGTGNRETGQATDQFRANIVMSIPGKTMSSIQMCIADEGHAADKIRRPVLHGVQHTAYSCATGFG